MALIILVWWYFQLALILAIATVWDLLLLYKEKRLNKLVSEFKQRITYVTGPSKEQLMFSATWFYDLIRQGRLRKEQNLQNRRNSPSVIDLRDKKVK